MSFSIKIEDFENSTKKQCLGSITIGNFQETFMVPLNYWKVNDYKQHWKNSLDRTLRREDSCLITSLYNPQKANFIVWWLLYSRRDTVVVRNHMLFLDALPSEFTPSNPYPFIPKYERKSEEGGEISEWNVSIRDIETFLSEYKR